MNLKSLKDTLIEKGSAVVNTNELSRYSGVNRKTTLQYASRMVKSGLLLDVERGKYALSEDPFDIASQIIFPSYVSFTAGLYLYGDIDQEINTIDVVSSKRHRKLKFGGADIRFSMVSPQMMFGFKKIKHGDFYLFVGEREKILLDMLYLPRKVRLNNISRIIKEADTEKLIDFAVRSGSEAVNRRLGYVLDFFGIKNDMKPIGDAKYKLNPSINNSGIYNAKWKLYINDEI